MSTIVAGIGKQQQQQHTNKIKVSFPTTQAPTGVLSVMDDVLVYMTQFLNHQDTCKLALQCRQLFHLVKQIEGFQHAVIALLIDNTGSMGNGTSERIQIQANDIEELLKNLDCRARLKIEFIDDQALSQEERERYQQPISVLQALDVLMKDLKKVDGPNHLDHFYRGSSTPLCASILRLLDREFASLIVCTDGEESVVSSGRTFRQLTYKDVKLGELVNRINALNGHDVENDVAAFDAEMLEFSSMTEEEKQAEIAKQKKRKRWTPPLYVSSLSFAKKRGRKPKNEDQQKAKNVKHNQNEKIVLPDQIPCKDILSLLARVIFPSLSSSTLFFPTLVAVGMSSVERLGNIPGFDVVLSNYSGNNITSRRQRMQTIRHRSIPAESGSGRFGGLKGSAKQTRAYKQRDLYNIRASNDSNVSDARNQAVYQMLAARRDTILPVDSSVLKQHLLAIRVLELQGKNDLTCPTGAKISRLPEERKQGWALRWQNDATNVLHALAELQVSRDMALTQWSAICASKTDFEALVLESCQYQVQKKLNQPLRSYKAAASPKKSASSSSSSSSSMSIMEEKEEDEEEDKKKLLAKEKRQAAKAAQLAAREKITPELICLSMTPPCPTQADFVDVLAEHYQAKEVARTAQILPMPVFAYFLLYRGLPNSLHNRALFQSLSHEEQAKATLKATQKAGEAKEAKSSNEPPAQEKKAKATKRKIEKEQDKKSKKAKTISSGKKEKEKHNSKVKKHKEKKRDEETASDEDGDDSETESDEDAASTSSSETEDEQPKGKKLKKEEKSNQSNQSKQDKKKVPKTKPIGEDKSEDKIEEGEARKQVQQGIKKNLLGGSIEIKKLNLKDHQRDVEYVIQFSLDKCTIDMVKQTLIMYQDHPDVFVMYGAFVSSGLVGLLGVEQSRPGSKCVIRHLSVLPSFRSQDIGKALYNSNPTKVKWVDPQVLSVLLSDTRF